MESVICKTSDGYNVYAIGLKDDKIYSIVIGWGKERPVHCHCQEIHDGRLAVEYDDECADPSDFCIGDRGYFSNTPLPASKSEADAAIVTISEKAYVTENPLEYCNITDAYWEFDSSRFAPYLFWSEQDGTIAGPGSDVSLKELLPNPEKQLWPIFDEAGIESIQKLRQVLSDRLPRKIEADNVLVYKDLGWGENHSFGYWASSSRLDLWDAQRWLDCLNGESVDGLRQAELDTIEQIDLWLKSKGVDHANP